MLGLNIPTWKSPPADFIHALSIFGSVNFGVPLIGFIGWTDRSVERDRHIT
jgi:hypothetical protein